MQMLHQPAQLPSSPPWVLLPSGSRFPGARHCQQGQGSCQEESWAESQRGVRAKNQISSVKVQQRVKSRQQGRAALLQPEHPQKQRYLVPTRPAWGSQGLLSIPAPPSTSPG